MTLRSISMTGSIKNSYINSVIVCYHLLLWCQEQQWALTHMIGKYFWSHFHFYALHKVLKVTVWSNLTDVWQGGVGSEPTWAGWGQEAEGHVACLKECSTGSSGCGSAKKRATCSSAPGHQWQPFIQAWLHPSGQQRTIAWPGSGKGWAEGTLSLVAVGKLLSGHGTETAQAWCRAQIHTRCGWDQACSMHGMNTCEVGLIRPWHRHGCDKELRTATLGTGLRYISEMGLRLGTFDAWHRHGCEMGLRRGTHGAGHRHGDKMGMTSGKLGAGLPPPPQDLSRGSWPGPTWHGGLDFHGGYTHVDSEQCKCGNNIFPYPLLPPFPFSLCCAGRLSLLCGSPEGGTRLVLICMSNSPALQRNMIPFLWAETPALILHKEPVHKFPNAVCPRALSANSWFNKC